MIATMSMQSMVKTVLVIVSDRVEKGKSTALCLFTAMAVSVKVDM